MMKVIDMTSGEVMMMVEEWVGVFSWFLKPLCIFVSVVILFVYVAAGYGI